MQSAEGKTFLHYKVIRKIGSGGMGVVYEAEDTSLGRRVALKFLPEALSQDRQSLDRFRREARAASALNHPGICTVYAIEEHDDRLFIVMELLEGRTLAGIIQERPLEVRELLDLAIQITDALESAHARGIVHRDIKPVNIFINPQGRAKILDFGLAKIESAAPGKGGAGSQIQTAIGTDDLTKVGTAMGTVAYMSPEQARGKVTDARTDLFSLGTVLYQMATRTLPFTGDTSAVVFDAILNREPPPVGQVNSDLPQELGRILGKALEKDREMRYQTATDLKTDLIRLRRDIESGARQTVSQSGAREAAESTSRSKSIAVLYFENLSGVKEDEYFRDGVTEDIITELSKIRNLNIFSRPTVLAYRDKTVTPEQIGQQLKAAYVLTGSVRRSGNRLRINTQLVDTHTDFPIWSERYDREMKDVFEVQDEIARKIAEALRVTLSPQERAAIAAKPTEDLQAYDLYLRGKSFARRLTRQDLEFALQMFENAATVDPEFALAHAAIASTCAQFYYHYERDPSWLERANAAAQRSIELRFDQPEVQVAKCWILYAERKHAEAIKLLKSVIAQKPDTEGAYYLLGRSLFAGGQYQEVIEMAESAREYSAEDYNILVPIGNALGQLGKKDALRNLAHQRLQVLEAHLKKVPEDGRARTLLAADFATLGRTEDAMREANLALALRPNEAIVLYNLACVFGRMEKTPEALDALKKAWGAGFRDVDWVRRDPYLTFLHGNPEFEKLYPADGASEDRTG